ncbi:MAG: hypothetical protein QXR65_09215 [Candidatus Bathyarchaeia archaeon]|nr:hypothetical protein [Candidatus Bathyarchaeota archaeon]
MAGDEEIRFCHECGTDLVERERLRLISIFLLVTLLMVAGILGYGVERWRRSSLELEAENAELAAEIHRLNTDMEKLNLRVEGLQAESSELRFQLAQATAELEKHRLKRPTINELRAFLEMDYTNEHRYDVESYICVHYARDLKANAAQRGYNLCFITVNYKVGLFGEERGHALNGAYLSDGSFVYIEPQRDKIHETLMDALRDLEDNPNIEIIHFVAIW